jgi:o-succinylbenzoate synthase
VTAAGPPVLPDAADLAETAAGLAGVELVRVRLALRRRLRAAHGTMPAQRDVVLVRALGHDGCEGWGECSALEAPTYTGEYTDGAWAVLRDHLVPAALAGRQADVRGHPMASAAVEVALTDVALRRLGRSLVDALGGPHGGEITWTLVTGIHDSTASLLSAVEEVLGGPGQDLGHAWFRIGAVKLKISPGWDLEPVGAVRRTWPGLRVVVDANGSYTPADAEQLVALAACLGDDAYVEQPLAADDLAGLAALAPRLAPRGIALDESIGSAHDVAAAAAAGAGSAINLKPARVGGLAASVAVAETARRASMSLFVGGMLETAIGRAAALAVAASRAVGATETDLGPSGHYFEPGADLADLPVSADGLVSALADQPGIGVQPDPDRLDQVAIDRLLIRR